MAEVIENMKEQLQQLLESPWMKENGHLIFLAVAVLMGAHILFTMSRPSAVNTKASVPFLDATIFQSLPLAEKRQITHNTLRLKFDLPTKTQRLGLPIGQHITFRAKDTEGKDVFRPYTPVSDDLQLGSVEFVIKLYPAGKMSQVLSKLEVGQVMEMKGPRGRFTYEPNSKQHLGMLAGGSGITPMYQVLMGLLRDPQDRTHISLVFGNITEEDILIREELDALAAAHPTRFRLHYVLNTPPTQGWSGGSGFISTDIIKAQLPAPGPGTLVLQCGPMPMMKVMTEHLTTLNYTEEMIFQF
ncbi:MAG: hypothetical protein WDW38_000679 [Sanguina aurantia]